MRKDYVDRIEHSIREFLPDLPKIKYVYQRAPIWKILLWCLYPKLNMISAGTYNAETNEIAVFPNNISATRFRTRYPDNVKLAETLFHEYFHWRRQNIYKLSFCESELREEELRAHKFANMMVRKFFNKLKREKQI